MPKAQEDRGETEAEADFEGEAKGTPERGIDHGSIEDYGLTLVGIVWLAVSGVSIELLEHTMNKHITAHGLVT